MELLKNKLNINFFVGIMFVFILIPSNLKSILILLIGIVIFYNAYLKKTKFNFDFFFNYSFLFFSISLTLFFTKDFQQGIYLFQTVSPLAIFPLYFAFITKDDFEKLKIENYVWIYLITIFIFHLLVFLWFALTEFSVQDTLRHYQEIVTMRLGKLSIHPIYVSMHCCIALFLSLQLFKDKISFSKKAFLVFLQISMVLFIILHSKKGPIAAFLVSFLLYIIISLKSVSLKIALPLFFLFVVFLISIPKVKSRFSEITNIENLTYENENSTNIRFAVYKYTFELIKNAPFFGYGLGGHNAALQEIYKINKQDILTKKNYNSHNQYLSFLLIGGPIILLVYIYFFIINVRKAILIRNKNFIFIIVFYSLVMLSENILERENGVIFFSFFCCFFGVKNYFKSNEK